MTTAGAHERKDRVRLTGIEIEKIARFIVKQIQKSGVSITDEDGADSVIIGIINQNLEEERRIEEDALKLLKRHRQASGAGLDEEKAFQMIKRKLAEERKFVL